MIAVTEEDSVSQIICGDALTILKTLPSEYVQCCITSPPYYGLRNYGVDGQIGLEPSPDEFIAKLVEVFREVRRVLRNDGTLWLNIGDSYASSGIAGVLGSPRLGPKGMQGERWINPKAKNYTYGRAPTPAGLKHKDLIGIPWMLAFALRADGWYLRMDCIWHKPNCMPESVKDRPTKSHEYLFLLSKSERYYYDAETIKEPSTRPGDVQTFGGTKGRNYTPHETDPNYRYGKEQWGRTITMSDTRNKRSVWTIATQPFNGASLLADYVGPDGKPYKVSPDCPIHGQYHDIYIQKKGEYDGQQDRVDLRTSDMPTYPVQEHVNVSSAIPSLLTQDLENANAHGHKSGSTHDRRNVVSSHNAELQIDHDTGDIQEISACSSGSQVQQRSQIATDHNKQNHKKGHVPETNPAYTPSVEISSHTDDMSMLPLWNDEAHHIHESNKGQDDTNAHTSVQTQYRNSDSSLEHKVSSFSCVHGITAKCTCQIVTLDHFAVMPQKLVEPCVLAGSNPGDIILDPFSGAATVPLTAALHGRDYIGIELNPAYVEMSERRIQQSLGIWGGVK